MKFKCRVLINFMVLTYRKIISYMFIPPLLEMIPELELLCQRMQSPLGHV